MATLKDINIAMGSRPFIIAELSGNHGQDLNTALALVEAAAVAGVDAIKLQTYRADTMTLDLNGDDFNVSEDDSLWQGENLYSLYEKASTPYEWHQVLFEKAQSLGLIAFSSPFDCEAVDFLDGLGVPCFKIASFEINDIPLIKHAASKGKPLIISAGMASIEEIQLAVDSARDAGCDEIVLLKCTSTYPSSPENSHLNTITDMKDRFGCPVGLSDHSRGIGVAVASVALGACVIEKHFVLDRSSGVVDAEFSMEPDEFKLLVQETHRAWEAMGEVTYGGSDAEQKSKKYRRSIYCKAEIKKGEILSVDNLQIIRPSFGLEPKEWDTVIGKMALTNISKGTPLDWSMVESD